MRQSNIVFLLRSSSKNKEELKEVFEFCWQNDMINVIAIFQDFSRSSTYYSFTNFGMFKIEEMVFKENENSLEFFPNRMHNLNGTVLNVLFDQHDMYLQIQDDQATGGPVCKMIVTFLTKHNAKLNTSYLTFSTLTPDDVVNLISNKTVNFTTIPMFLELATESFAYPLLEDVGIILPIEPRIPIFKVFTRVLSLRVFLITIVIIVLFSAILETAAFLSGNKSVLLNFVIDLNCLRGILGQSFNQRPISRCSTKIIYLLIFLYGMMLSTSYNAFLHTFMYEPPKELFIQSLEDVRASDLKIKVSSVGIAFIYNHVPGLKENYSEVFLIESKNKSRSVVEEINSWDTKYARIVSVSDWELYEHLQNFLGKKSFRWSQELCLIKGIALSWPIYENSIYKDILNMHLINMVSSGLWDYWRRRMLFDEINISKLKLKDLQSKQNAHSIKVEDFKWILMAIGMGFGISSCCFVAEICIFKWKNHIKVKFFSLKAFLISRKRK
ncbi:uncharacterized protein LOC129950402 [Eupeodes corollae]|uniref:uncharacterized protein LOC129950402 n=1 Tax=Eupeodes corollae TaxID=290404 RepID=UPI0024918391|nr:uncharacterized protein LOC129950402 [Eupeodes corollae]